ncbi:MAG: polyprenyl synthetase family protein [Desulfobacterales bacterium]
MASEAAIRSFGPPSGFDLKAYLAAHSRRINDALAEILVLEYAGSRLAAAMRYSLNAGGKRIRPILCLAAAEAVGGTAESVMPAACAIEMIHTYSLIHDDLPAMDDDRLRRGKPTCHIAFDEATAILAGDGLLTMAFQVLSRPEHLIKTVDNRTKLQVIHLLSSAAGPDGMIEGQMRDLEAEGVRIGLEDLQNLHELKTGALIRASVVCGALLSSASEMETERLETYARNIGLAFQVTDDILNVEGDPDQMGKARGSDELRGKSTYPGLLGLEASRQFARDLITNSLKAIDVFDNRSDPLRAIAQYILERRR